MSGVYMGIYHQGNIMHPMTSSNRMFYRQPYTPQHNLHLFHNQMNHPGLMGQNHFIPQHAKQHVIMQEPVFPKFPPQNFDIPDISSSNSVYGDSAYGSSPLSPSTALNNPTPTSRQSSYACISAPPSEVPSNIESQQEQHPPVNAQFPQQRWSVPAPAAGSNDSSPVSQSEDNSANFDSNLPFISAQTQPVTLQQVSFGSIQSSNEYWAVILWDVYVLMLSLSQLMSCVFFIHLFFLFLMSSIFMVYFFHKAMGDAFLSFQDFVLDNLWHADSYRRWSIFLQSHEFFICIWIFDINPLFHDVSPSMRTAAFSTNY